jgi:hypothetical protein
MKEEVATENGIVSNWYPSKPHRHQSEGKYKMKYQTRRHSGKK